MSWFNVWDGIKNKTCRYLLQRYLGQFLQGRINLEQMKIDLYNGRATVKDVFLKVEVLNELFEAQCWSFEIIEGYIGELTVTVPWNALMIADTSIEVSDMRLTVRPLKRQNDGTSTLESMWSSVSSSMQLAEECMKQQDANETAQELQQTHILGLEKFAETIDNVLNRIKAKFYNTRLRVEYQFHDRLRGIALVTTIELLKYRNESSDKTQTMETGEDSNNEETTAGAAQTHALPSFAKHNVCVSGIRVYTDEFVCSDYESRPTSEDESEQMPRVESNEENKCIPVLEIKGLQKIDIKMKQSEDIPGPKIYLDVELGKVFALMTPRQVHLLVKIYNTFCEEEESTAGLHKPQIAASSKHEEELRTNHAQMTGLLRQGNWGSSDYEEASTSYQIYHETESAANTNSELYCDSLSSSISSSSITTCTSRFQRRIANKDSCGEILNFNIRLACLEAVLLHDDILVEANRLHMCRVHPFNEHSHKDLVKLAEKFFANCLQAEASKSLNGKNHLYLQLSPLFAEGLQQRNKNCLLFKFSVTATKVDLFEVLEGVPTNLIQFDRQLNCADGYHKRPELNMMFKSTSYCKRKATVTTTINIILEKSTVEFDISLYDRISAIFAPTPFNFMESKNDISFNVDPPAVNDDKSLTEVRIESRHLDARLRFPIVDARPLQDPQRFPWWKKNIRTDFVLFTFYQLNLNIFSKTIEILANEIDVFYCENNCNPLHILKTVMAKDGIETNFTYPKITIYLPTDEDLANISLESENTDDSANMNFNIDVENLTPFSSKRVCRQSDATHTDDEYETILLPGETQEIHKFTESTMKSSKVQIKINIPTITLNIGSKQLYETIYNRLNTDLLMWEPSSPLLRKQSSTTPAASQMFHSLFTANLMTSIYASSPLQNTGMSNVPQNMLDDSDTEKSTTSCEESENESIYFSINEQAQQQKHQLKSKTHMANIIEDHSSVCCVDICVLKGNISLFMPVRDTENRVLPAQNGRIQFIVDNLKVFCVSGYKGDNHLNYVCLESNNVDCYHCGRIPIDVPLELNDEIGEYMQSTLYQLPQNLTKGVSPQKAKTRENITFVIEVKKLPEQRIKRLRLTTGLQKLTLRHNPCLPAHSWLKQLIDFFDVLDYPIEGYKPFKLITEMQLHAWDFAIDYRPTNFNYRAVVEIGTFSICSNVIPAVVGCNLRFVVEDSVLSIAQYDKNKYNLPDFKITSIPATNLIPVLEVGLVDISLRLCESIYNNYPKFDLRCGVHDAHLRTCADSGSALAQLVAHLANDGDVPNAHDTDDTLSLESSAYSDAELLASNNYVPEISEKQQEHVNLMMAQAVQETVTGSHSSMQSSASSNSSRVTTHSAGIEVFYFPDESKKLGEDESVCEEDEDKNKSELCDILNFESNVMLTSHYNQMENVDTLPQIKAELGEILDYHRNTTSENLDFLSQEDDYCIIGEEEKVFMENFGVKNVNLSDDPLRIVENHFCLPAAKLDLLLPPENFPIAQFRYTLCEMNFTWHLYGGRDFADNINTNTEKQFDKKSHQSNMSEAYKYGVSYSKSTQRIGFDKKPKEKITWKTAGGAQRNHEVLVEIQLSKVRFSHEEYAPHTSQASRQVLLVGDFEIRDRLQSSDINKFLYHPKNKSIVPKNARNVMVIKALHVRPKPLKCADQECSLRVSLLPMRLHIDQDTLLFIAEFFASIETGCSSEEEINTSTQKLSHLPVMSVDEIPEALQDLQARQMVATNLDLLMDNNTTLETKTIETTSTVSSQREAPTTIYFREIVFSPEVKICFDYHGRRVEMSRGPIAGLLMGLGQLHCSEITLKKVIHRRGILGLDKLLAFLCKEWLKDIKRNQLPKILSGVGPTHAFVQLFKGIYDLFALPLEQYQKDGRIIRGLQLGAQSFTARTVLAALEITSRIIHLLQFTAETTFDMVSAGPSIRRSRKIKKGKKKRTHHPKDIREGMTNAYMIVKEGINESANTLMETAATEHDRKGYTGAVGAVMRQIPQLVICPAVLATQATTNILGGVKSSLVPGSKIEAREKWKDESD